MYIRTRAMSSSSSSSTKKKQTNQIGNRNNLLAEARTNRKLHKLYKRMRNPVIISLAQMVVCSCQIFGRMLHIVHKYCYFTTKSSGRSIQTEIQSSFWGRCAAFTVFMRLYLKLECKR